MRHPNNPDIVYINFCRIDEGERDNWLLEFDETNRTLTKRSDLDRKTNTEIRKLIAFYKQIEASGLMPEYALQVEFGLNPLSIYQARPFKKFETADFQLPTDKNGFEPEYIFGITKSEGIVLPIVRSYSFWFTKTNCPFLTGERPDNSIYDDIEMWNAADMIECLPGISELSSEDIRKSQRMIFVNRIKAYHRKADERFQDGYAIVIDEAHQEPYLMDITIPNMKAFLCGNGQNFLTHSLFRQMQNADVSLVHFIDITKYHETLKSGNNVRIISNGKQGVAIPE